MNSRKIDPLPPHTFSLSLSSTVKASVTNSDKVLVGPLKCSIWSPISNRTEKRGGIISGVELSFEVFGDGVK